MAPPEADPDEWIARARTDLSVAEVLLRDPKMPSWPAGFHLQQAAEKTLKAVLVSHGRVAPRTHDLVQLADAVEALDDTLAGWAERLLPLIEFGVAQRYPVPYETDVELQPIWDEVARLLDDAAARCAVRRAP